MPGNATGRTYTGSGPDTADAGTVWDRPVYTANATTTGLLNSAGAATSVSYMATGVAGNWASNYDTQSLPPGQTYNTLLSTIVDQNYPNQMTFTFGGLAAGNEYDLYAIMNSNANGRITYFAVSGTTQSVVTANLGNTPVTSTNVYTEFTNLTPSAGQIVVTAYGHAGEFDVNGFQLVPLISQSTLSWAGTSATNPNLWDTSTPNWSGALGNTYANGEAVIFTDSGINTNITITGSGVSPGLVQFTANTTPYSFSGGGITGSATVALGGSGLVTFSNSNSFGGGTAISSGTLVAANNAALGTGSVTVNAPGVLDFVTAAPAISGAERQRQHRIGRPTARHQSYDQRRNFSGGISQVASGTGSLTMAGAGSTLILSGTNTYSGGTTVSAGTLSASPAALGSGAIALSGGALSATAAATYANAVNVTASSLLASAGR